MAVTNGELEQLFCPCGKKRILTGDYAQCSMALENWMQAHGGLVPVDARRFKRVQEIERLPVAVMVGRKRIDFGGEKRRRTVYVVEGNDCVSGEDLEARVERKWGWGVVKLQTIEDAVRRCKI